MTPVRRTVDADGIVALHGARHTAPDGDGPAVAELRSVCAATLEQAAGLVLSLTVCDHGTRRRAALVLHAAAEGRTTRRLTAS